MGKLILTVDDSASVRQMVGFTMRAAAYEVAEAVDGRDALSKLSGDIHLVITDVNMPRMDGIELIRQIRTKSTNKFVPILVLTTESQAAKKQEAKSAGATGWIVKPFQPDQLLAVVQRVLG
jgi:two-component system, chemotaxis family, chemotaxis protein CheY